MYEDFKLNLRADKVELSSKPEHVLAAVEQLLNNLESIDIIDLIQSAICFYDTLTIDPNDRIGLCIYSRTHEEKDRIEAVKTKFKILMTDYRTRAYMDPSIAPLTVKQLLIKMEHLAFYQLPEYEAILPESYRSENHLNWKTFFTWMTSVNANKYYTTRKLHKF